MAAVLRGSVPSTQKVACARQSFFSGKQCSFAIGSSQTFFHLMEHILNSLHEVQLFSLKQLPSLCRGLQTLPTSIIRYANHFLEISRCHIGYQSSRPNQTLPSPRRNGLCERACPTFSSPCRGQIHDIGYQIKEVKN